MTSLNAIKHIPRYLAMYCEKTVCCIVIDLLFLVLHSPAKSPA